VAILVAMPNLEGLASFLVVVAIGFAVASWVMTGSARISYAGIQIGVAFSMCMVDVPHTTVNLLPARDRVVGSVIGIVVTGFVFRGLGHARARQEMRLELAKTLRALAELARVGVSGLVDPRRRATGARAPLGGLSAHRDDAPPARRGGFRGEGGVARRRRRARRRPAARR
jgi:uncharacterized membrane protein YccC